MIEEMEITMDEALESTSSFTTDICRIESKEPNPESDFLSLYKLEGYELYL